MKSRTEELFGSMVFSDREMRAYLPDHIFRALSETRKEGKALEPDIADAVAAAMKNWAISKGATHYTHWFQPMTGVTAEKHEAFLEPEAEGGAIMEFSGKELIKGEPDASSFPTGGLRTTFEARGYTAWDPTSDAFIKENTLCIPTTFCSYTGEVLDKKTPLLRSMEALSREACRLLRLLGKEVKRVNATVGCEQEYFLIKRSDYEKRMDLRLCGRTLFGAPAPKGQELSDHYFGSIKPQVKAFMEEVDEELWKLGIFAKTEHNEVAPCQHELAPVFQVGNIAADQNQLVMEVLKKTAARHDLACLLHEKPFEGINGSGKHNNWALSTDTGENLLKPGEHPEENLQFLLFFTAVIRAVDEYQDLLRISVATAGNDHRLGGHEAPPAIVSMFIGDDLMRVAESLMTGKNCPERKETGSIANPEVLPEFPRDRSDRNRTSPFAFTGNKFEFRMPGSMLNVSCTNVMLNTAVAESLRVYANRLEKEDGRLPEQEEILQLVRNELKTHKRILFNGNGYSEAWVKEAEKRGLLNLASTPEAYAWYTADKNLKLFQTHGIYTEEEVQARQQVGFEEYEKTVRIEAETMLQMLHREIFPAAFAYSAELAAGIDQKRRIGLRSWQEEELAKRLTEGVDRLRDGGDALERLLQQEPEEARDRAFYSREKLLPAMKALRKTADGLEQLTARNRWPFPDYTELLFYV